MDGVSRDWIMGFRRFNTLFGHEATAKTVAGGDWGRAGSISPLLSPAVRDIPKPSPIKQDAAMILLSPCIPGRES